MEMNSERKKTPKSGWRTSDLINFTKPWILAVQQKNENGNDKRRRLWNFQRTPLSAERAAAASAFSAAAHNRTE